MISMRLTAGNYVHGVVSEGGRVVNPPPHPPIFPSADDRP